MPIKKKPKIIFIADAKFSASPKKLANKLNEILPTHKSFVRLKHRPLIHETPSRRIFQWGGNVDKLQQYTKFTDKGIPCPLWTTDINIAKTWLGVGHTVVGRTLLNSFGGQGILIFDQNNPLPEGTNNCKVFTQYKKKKHEFRIHVFNGKIIDFAQKKKQKEANNNNNVNTKIRNYKNGWVYCRENVSLPTKAFDLAIAATTALNLQHGAVDLLYNEHEDTYYVLEVNSAPGLSGSTVESYAQAFKQLLITP